MKLFLLMLVSIISFSGLAQSAQSIVGSWSAVGGVCDTPSAGIFRVIERVEDGTEAYRITDDLITFIGDDCETTASYTYSGSTLALNKEGVFQSNCSNRNSVDDYGESINAFVKDDLLYMQIPENVIQFLMTLGTELQEGCTPHSVYKVFSRN